MSKFTKLILCVLAIDSIVSLIFELILLMYVLLNLFSSNFASFKNGEAYPTKLILAFGFSFLISTSKLLYFCLICSTLDSTLVTKSAKTFSVF